MIAFSSPASSTGMSFRLGDARFTGSNCMRYAGHFCVNLRSKRTTVCPQSCCAVERSAHNRAFNAHNATYSDVFSQFSGQRLRRLEIPDRPPSTQQRRFPFFLNATSSNFVGEIDEIINHGNQSRFRSSFQNQGPRCGRLKS